MTWIPFQLHWDPAGTLQSDPLQESGGHCNKHDAERSVHTGPVNQSTYITVYSINYFKTVVICISSPNLNSADTLIGD